MGRSSAAALDYFALLGVRADAGNDEIKSDYRELARTADRWRSHTWV